MSVKFSVVEGINADVNADFSISSALDISSQTAVKKALAVTTNHILVYSDSAVYFRFDLSSTTDTINTSNDLILPASTLISLRVPNGLAPEDGGSDEIVYFHAKQVTSASSKSFRLVEC